MQTYRNRKYIGAYMAVLGRVDGIVFTAGIGENDAIVRAESLKGLEFLGVRLDADKNKQRAKEARCISTDDSPVRVFDHPHQRGIGDCPGSGERRSGLRRLDSQGSFLMSIIIGLVISERKHEQHRLGWNWCHGAIDVRASSCRRTHRPGAYPHQGIGRESPGSRGAVV